VLLSFFFFAVQGVAREWELLTNGCRVGNLQKKAYKWGFVIKRGLLISSEGAPLPIFYAVESPAGGRLPPTRRGSIRVVSPRGAVCAFHGLAGPFSSRCPITSEGLHRVVYRGLVGAPARALGTQTQCNKMAR